MIRTDPTTLTAGTISASSKLEQLFDTTGDGSGTTEMAAASAIYKVVPPAGTIYDVHRINVYVEDNTKFEGGKYAGAASLINGIDITVHNAGGSVLRFTQQKVKKIGHWDLLAGIDMLFTNFTSGNDLAAIRWTIARSGPPMTLNGDAGEFIQIEVGDDLSSLVSHMAQVQGTKEST
jgi:hypothetical protein